MAEPTRKNPDIRKLQSEIMGRSVKGAIIRDRCVSCQGPATEFRNLRSQREFTISGLCQSCQDEVFQPHEDD